MSPVPVLIPVLVPGGHRSGSKYYFDCLRRRMSPGHGVWYKGPSSTLETISM